MQAHSPQELAAMLRAVADLFERMFPSATARVPDTVPCVPATAPDSVPDCPPVPAPLSACAQDALEAAADGEWHTSIELAGEAGWPYSGRWRGVVAELVRRGLLERDRRTKRLRLAEHTGH